MTNFRNYVLADLFAKASVTAIMLVLAKLVSEVEYAKLGVFLAVVGFLVPVLTMSADVALVRLERREEFGALEKRRYLGNHFLIASFLAVLFILIFGSLPIIPADLNFYEVVMLGLYSLVISLFAVNERSITFNLKYDRSAFLISLPTFILLLGLAIAYQTDQLQWEHRIEIHMLGLVASLLVIAQSNYRIFELKFDATHSIETLKVAKWLTPQIILNGVYIYGDRLLAAGFLDATDFTSFLIVAQVAFLLSFFNRLINTFWQSQYFSSKLIRDNGSITYPLIFAGSLYFLGFLASSFLFSRYFGDPEGNMRQAFILLSSGFLLQIYYHLTNAKLLWDEQYGPQLLTSLLSAFSSVFGAIALYPILDWVNYPVVFLLSVSVQFLMVNIFALKSGLSKAIVKKNILVLAFVLLAYFVAVSSLSKADLF